MTIWDIMLLLILIKRKDNMSIQSDTTKSIESLLEICKTLRNFIDLQSKRIDLLQKQFDTNQKILARYQMTEGSDEQRNNN